MRLFRCVRICAGLFALFSVTQSHAQVANQTALTDRVGGSFHNETVQFAQSHRGPRRSDRNSWDSPSDFEQPQRAPSARNYGEDNGTARIESVDKDELAPIDVPRSGDEDFSATPQTDRYETTQPSQSPRTQGTTSPMQNTLRGDVWRDLDVDSVETFLSAIKPAPRSPVLHRLWQQLMTTDSAPPKGRSADAFAVVRARALYRAGRLSELSEWVSRRRPAENKVAQAVLELFAASANLGLGRKDKACAATRNLAAQSSALPDGLKGDAILITGYCAAADGNTAAAGLSAQLAREAGVEESIGVASLEAVGSGRKPAKPKASSRLSLIDYSILSAIKIRPALHDSTELAPDVLIAIANDENQSPFMRILAGEAAVSWNALETKALIELYRDASAIADAANEKQQLAAQRAQAFAAAEATRDPRRRVQHVIDYLRSAQASNMGISALRLAFLLIEPIRPSRELQSLGEIAIRLAIAADRPDIARRWANIVIAPGTPNFDRIAHWFGLIDIASNKTTRVVANRDYNAQPNTDTYAQGPSEQESLRALERHALAGGFKPELLHKLATVLDALAYQVPIPLWEAASQTPQPTTGHLPETGVLSDLSAAAKDQAIGKTFLLSMKAIGPKGPRDTQMIALGDTVRALKRLGFEAEARRVAVEALILDWP